jgi:hypothetical protein
MTRLPFRPGDLVGIEGDESKYPPRGSARRYRGRAPSPGLRRGISKGECPTDRYLDISVTAFERTAREPRCRVEWRNFARGKASGRETNPIAVSIRVLPHRVLDPTYRESNMVIWEVGSPSAPRNPLIFNKR